MRGFTTPTVTVDGVDHILGNATARAVQESINAGKWAA